MEPYEEGIIVLKNSNVYHIPLEDMVKEANYYSEQSKTSKLAEVSIDDFVSWYVGVKNTGQALVFDHVVDAVKAGNSKLRFGVTIYETELPGYGTNLPGSPGYTIEVMPEAQRRRIDVVHLFIYYRPNCTKIAQYVDIVHREFPSSQVVIGLYNQDRRKTEKRAATTAEEESMFSNCVKLASSLIAGGRAAAIEFWPGNFGLESNTYKNTPEAAQIAVAMRKSALSILKAGVQ